MSNAASSTASSTASPTARRTSTPHRLRLPSLPLECGQTLREPTLAFHLHGELNARRDNVVVVLHALTGSSHAADEWWSGLIGPGAPIDTDRVAVVVPNLLGSCYGSTGPVEGEPFPVLTTRDQARAVAVLLERLDVRGVELVTGGSLGGMVTLEFAASFPGRTQRALVFAAPAQQTGWARGWNGIQRDLVKTYGNEGLEHARRVAMLSYRTPEGLDRRFGRAHVPGDVTQSGVGDWLAHHGRRLRSRFTAASYLTLLGAMDSHDVARDGQGVAERLRASGTQFTGVGIPGDILYPVDVVEEWTRLVGGRYEVIRSEHGHDAFLIEKDQVARLLRQALAAPVDSAPSAPLAEVA